MSGRILIVDENESNLYFLRDALSVYYDLDVARSAEECVQRLEQFRPELVVLDYVSQGPSALDLCRLIKAGDREIQVILLTGGGALVERLQGYEAGADDCLVKPVDTEELHAKIHVQLRLRKALDQVWSLNTKVKSYNAELERLVENKTAALEATQDVTVFALAKLADSRDSETGAHLERMRLYTQILAKQLGQDGPYTDQIDELFLEDLYRASPLHDIGKVGIPDSILLKPARLTRQEFERMKEHTVVGAETLEEASRHLGGASFLKMAADIARHHHERFDGTGYPSGLRGKDIPFSARIVALADVYDAMTSERVYKTAMEPLIARELILAESGKHFDPAIVDGFAACFDQFLKVPEIISGRGTRHNLVVDASPTMTFHGLGEPQSSPEGRKVLLVDDDIRFLENATAWLSAAGFQVRRAADTTAARIAITEDCPHFIIADFDKAGAELSRFVRRHRLPHYVYTIMVANRSRLSALTKALEEGADEFLCKPLVRGEVLARMQLGTKLLELVQRLSQKPRHDPLTGVATRNSIDTQLVREWRRSTRYRIPLSCLLIDIDGFQRINDRFGHAGGDRVLEHVAGLLNDHCRSADYLFRHGPDMFCLVMTETNEHGATCAAERILSNLAGSTLIINDQPLRVAASCGVAQRMTNHTNVDQMISMAEQAIAIAKRSDENRKIVRFAAVKNSQLPGLPKKTAGHPFRTLIARDLMTSPIVSIHEDASAQTAADFLIRYRINSAPVVDADGTLVGVISEKDLLTMMVGEAAWLRPIRETMSTNVISFDENASVHAIYNFLVRAAIRRVIIVRANKPVGVISRGTLVRWFEKRFREQGNNRGQPEIDEHLELTELELMKMLGSSSGLPQ